MPDRNETLGDDRDFGAELRQARDNRPEQVQLLREIVMAAARVDMDDAIRVFEAFRAARLVFSFEEDWATGIESTHSQNRAGADANLLPPEDHPADR